MIKSITIEDKEIKELLSSIRSRFGNLRPVLVEIGEEYTKRVYDRFESETDPDGKKWIPTKVLSNYLGFVGTRKGYKRKQAYTQKGRWRAAFSRYLDGKKTLHLTGDLRDDIHPQVDDTSVSIGTSGRVRYAAVHQFGGPAGRKSKRVMIPARPYLARNTSTGMELGDSDRRMIIERISAYLARR